MMNRRLIIILALIILLALGGGVLYAYSKQQQQQPTVVEDNTTPLQLKRVLNEEVIAPVAGHDNNSIWYFNSEGRLFKINVDGSNLSEFPLPALPGKYLRSALWPKIGGDIIVVSGDDQSRSYYDSTAKTFINLAKNIQFIDWLPDSKRVIYIWKTDDGKSQQLVMADADGTGYKKIVDVFWPDLAVKAGNDGKTALMYRTNIVGDTNKIYAVNLETGQISTLVEDGNNTAVGWLPVGNKFLFERDSKIYLYDLDSKQIVDLKLNTTLNKVVSDTTGKTLFANINGEFVKVDLSNNRIENYYKSDIKVQARSLFLVGNTLYYIDNVDGKLYTFSN